MQLQLLLLTVASLAAASPDLTGHKRFLELVASLDTQYDEDMDAIKESEQIYLDGVKEHIPYVEEVELLVGEEEEMKEEPDETDLSFSPRLTVPIPESLDLRELGIVHGAIWQGAGCGSCGWLSGVQTLEARMALVSENYVPYSVQNFMNCDGRVCGGSQPYRVNSLARNNPEYIALESEMPYTKKACLKTTSCRCTSDYKNYTRVIDEQFAFIGPTLAAHTEQTVLEALQTGPLTTCFAGAKGTGERCKFGCGHANSIIGYTKDKVLLQENYGKNWGKEKDGSWTTTRGSNCSKAVINKAYYPVIFYDYDRANAFFTDTAVDEAELKFVDKNTFGITFDNTKNIGVAKNKCAYLGSACKGVVSLSSGAFELVADFGAGSPGTQKAFKKTQMVVYLKHGKTGKYLGITKNKGLNAAKDAINAAPFFTSHAKFVSFDLPEYHIVDNKLEKISGGITHIDELKSWSLKDCNLYNAKSGLSLDVVELLDDELQTKSIGGNSFNKTSTSQRFDIGISGEWLLRSRELGLPLGRFKKGEKHYAFEEEGTNKYSTVPFRWNARQIMTYTGKPIDHVSMKLLDKYFDISEADNVITPTDCTISKLIGPDGAANHLTVQDGTVVLSTETEGRWTFKYANL